MSVGTSSYWQAGGSGAGREADVVIVGAGITGASTAFWLRRMRPDIRIVIVDRHTVAAGASGRNAGFLLRGTAENYAEALQSVGTERALRLMRFTAASIDSLRASVPAEVCALEGSGSVVAAGDADEDAALRESERLLRACGERVRYLEVDEVNRKLDSRGFRGGLFDPAGATVDPVRLVRHLVAASGADVWTHRAVSRIDDDGPRQWAVSEHDRFGGHRVVLALNAYLPQLVPELAQFVRPVRAQMFAARPANGARLSLPVYSHHGYFYARSTDNGTLLVGGARHLHVEAETGYDDATTSVLQADLEAYVARHFPGFGEMDVLRRWSGVMGFSPDGLPVIGRIGADGPFWAAGYTGHGMAFGFGVGRILARLALGEDAGEEVELFAPQRLS